MSDTTFGHCTEPFFVGARMINVGPVLVICPAVSFRSCDCHPLFCYGCGEARSPLKQQNSSLVLCSASLVDGDFRDVVKAAKSVPVVALSHVAERSPYLAALRAGAFDYITCPPDPGEVKRILWSAVSESSRLHRTATTAA